MNQKTTIGIVVALAVLVLGLFIFQSGIFSAARSPETPIVDTENAGAGRAMSIDQYVRQNISELSPVKEQLGGTYYVTELEADNGVGIVSYEDGHTAYMADFTYAIDPEHGGITITSFLVRPQ